MILRNGSLLIYNLTEEDEAVYRCSFVFAGYPLDGAAYNLSLSDNAAGKKIVYGARDYMLLAVVCNWVLIETL